MRAHVLIMAVILFVVAMSTASEEYAPSQENLAARDWFREARFGMFVHWGIYSLLGEGEWVLHNDRMTLDEYEKLPPQFNPVKFDADEWCAIAEDAGMRYITITSKHHDGFAMFGSEQTNYDIVDATPYGRDVMKDLAEACERHGLKLFFYHSHLDWRHPDYYPRGRTGNYTGRPDNGNWSHYLDYMDAQLTDLLTNYGPIGGIWFDGWWDKPDADWRLRQTYDLIHELQPAALVGNNHHVAPFPGEDFQMFERGLPGHDPYSENGVVSDALPLEMCETINGSWGFNKSDAAHKSTEDLIELLVKAAGYDANLLLNVGPRPDGTILRVHARRLREVGEWLATHGDAIYGTRGGPVAPQSWGVTTHNDDSIFVHVVGDDTAVALPGLAGEIKSARAWNGTKVPFVKTELGTILTIPDEAREPFDTIIVLDR